MEHAHNILFFDKATPATLPDVKVLEGAFELADVGILIVSKTNEVLYANHFANKAAAYFQIKSKLVPILNYNFASEGSGCVSFEIPDTPRVLQVRSSIVQWNGEKAALFLVKEESAKAVSASLSNLQLATLFIDTIQLPLLIFYNDVLTAANVSAIHLLNIEADEIAKTHFNCFFEKHTKADSQKPEALIDAVHFKAVLRTEKAARALVTTQLPLDGKLYRIIQILPNTLESESDAGDKNFSAHDVISMASHDLREPVRTITNYSQLTVEKLKNGKYKQAFEYAQMTNAAALHMDKLLGDLKVLISVDDIALEKKKVHTEAMLKAAIAEVLKFHSAENFEIRLHQLPEIEGNEKLLILLFRNLFDNAIKFRKGDKAQIEVAAEKEDTSITFCVRDNGVGIARKHHQKVFEPFERLNRIDEYPGSGLGLTIAKKIIEKHGGSIHIESMLHAGTGIYISFPK